MECKFRKKLDFGLVPYEEKTIKISRLMKKTGVLLARRRR